MRPPGPASAFSAPFGGIPWSDNRAHVEGGNRLLAGDAFGYFSERRPLTASLLGVRLALSGGNLRRALLLQAVLLGVSVWLAARLVGIRAGLAPAMAAFALILGLCRDFLPTAATEPLGIALSFLGVAILISPRAWRHLGLLAGGLFALDAALHARPGPQFLLPAIMASALYAFRARWKKAAAMLVLVAAAGGLSTTALNALYGAGDSSFTAYPAYTLYGLTRNANWKQAAQDFPEVVHTWRESDAARFLYRKAFDNLRRTPTDFLRALGRNLGTFFKKLPANLTRALSLRSLFVDSMRRVRPLRSEVVGDLLAGVPIVLAAALGFLVFLRRSGSKVAALFWLAAGVGVLLSVPFVYGDAGFRGLAAAYPFIAVALAFGMSGGRSRPLLTEPALRTERRLLRTCGLMAVGLVGAALVGPAFVRAWPLRPERRDLRDLVPGRQVVMYPARASAVVVTIDRSAPSAEMPRLERRQFLRLLDLAMLDADRDAYLRSLRSPFLLMSAYDFVSRHQQFVVGPIDIVRQDRGFAKLDVQAAPVRGILEVTSWEPLGASSAGLTGDSDQEDMPEEAPAPEPEPWP
jgi:hypothetical protein